MTQQEKKYCEYLGEIYSSSDIEEYIYLTSKRRGDYISKSELEAALDEGRIGYVLREYDPIAFEVGMQEWAGNDDDDDEDDDDDYEDDDDDYEEDDDDYEEDDDDYEEDDDDYEDDDWSEGEDWAEDKSVIDGM